MTVLTKNGTNTVCRTIVDGFTQQCERTHATIGAVAEEDSNVRCVDDVASKELPWSAVRHATEEEVKYLRDVGVYEKVDERTAFAEHGVTPVDTEWIDTDEPDLYAGTLPLEGLKRKILIGANHWQLLVFLRACESACALCCT